MIHKLQYVLGLAVLTTQLTAFPFFNLVERPLLEDSAWTVDLLDSGKVFSAKYTIESRPGPDFLDYRKRLGTLPADLSDAQLLNYNSKSAQQTLVWNTTSFHLISVEQMNDHTMKRQRLWSEGLLVDYFPARPSAYIRSPEHPADYLTLYDLLNQIPTGHRSLGDIGRANAWSSVLTVLPEILNTRMIQETDTGFAVLFYRQFPDFENRVGFQYRFDFVKTDSGALLSIIEVAIADSQHPDQLSFRRPILRTELLNHTAEGLPRFVQAKLWRYARDSETDEQRQYFTREITCSLQFIRILDEDYDFSLDYEKGTFVTDERTGSKYRVGD